MSRTNVSNFENAAILERGFLTTELLRSTKCDGYVRACYYTRMVQEWS